MSTERYVGVKVVDASPMTRAAYNEYRNWALPADEDGTDEGYLVEYADGGRGNDSRHAGYISWSPKDVFERSYSPRPTPPGVAPHEQHRRISRLVSEYTTDVNTARTTLNEYEVSLTRAKCDEAELAAWIAANPQPEGTTA